MSDLEHFDIVVLGGGSGLTAAYHAGRDRKSVAVIDERPDALGGTCVNRGCIPTKGLIQAAEVMQTIRAAERFGIQLDQSSVRVDFRAITDTVRERRATSAKNVKAWVDDAFTPVYERVRFVDDKVLESESGRRITGDRIFITTGTRPTAPPIPGLADIGYWTNETVIELTEQPRSLLVLGGGYIGAELGHFFAGLGTEVTVVDHSECLLREDDDVRALFTREFARHASLVLNADVIDAFERDGRPGLTVEQGGERRTLHADALLVAAGRRPNTDTLALEASGVETDEHGFVRVDERLQTTHPEIYAYGDIIGQAMFKHTSSYEGELAYRNSQGEDLQVTYRANPHAVFGDPQIGSVGLTERACREQGLDYAVAKKDYADFAKGKIIGAPPGFAKLIVERGSDRILGFHMVGPQAADLIHEVVVAMNAGDGQADLVRRTIHVHPTLSELVRQVFDELG